MSTKQYVTNIKNTVQSIWAGLTVTFSHLLRRPITVQYPDVSVKERLPERYRGLLEVDTDVCTLCQACERACPIACIAIEIEKDPANPKNRYMTRFDIDAAKCMYCGLCVEQCTTGAISHTREFEATSAAVDNLVLRYVDPLEPKLPYKVQKGVEAPRRPVGSIVRTRLPAWNARSPLGPAAEPSAAPKSDVEVKNP